LPGILKSEIYDTLPNHVEKKISKSLLNQVCLSGIITTYYLALNCFLYN
jgi:hypothetical protein